MNISPRRAYTALALGIVLNVVGYQTRGTTPVGVQDVVIEPRACKQYSALDFRKVETTPGSYLPVSCGLTEDGYHVVQFSDGCDKLILTRPMASKLERVCEQKVALTPNDRPKEL